MCGDRTRMPERSNELIAEIHSYNKSLIITAGKTIFLSPNFLVFFSSYGGCCCLCFCHFMKMEKLLPSPHPDSRIFRETKLIGGKGKEVLTSLSLSTHAAVDVLKAFY